jgi:hypothetical protein
MNLERLLQIATADTSLTLLSHLHRRGKGGKGAEPARPVKLDKEKSVIGGRGASGDGFSQITKWTLNVLVPVSLQS